MIATVAKWGNSLAVRLPAHATRELDLGEGSQVELAVTEGALVLRPIPDKGAYDLDTLLAGITKENLHGEIDTGPSVGNEL